MKDPKIIALRERIGKEVTGNPEFVNAEFVGLDAKDKIAITNLMKAEIASNPEEYSETQVKLANRPDITQIEEFDFFDAAQAAVEGAGEGAQKFGSNLGTGLKTVLILAAVASGAVAVMNLTQALKKK